MSNEKESNMKLFEGLYENETSAGPGEKTTLTLWIDKSYKAKYAHIQKRSKNEFGKRLQKLIKQVIDQVESA